METQRMNREIGRRYQSTIELTGWEPIYQDDGRCIELEICEEARRIEQALDRLMAEAA